MTIVDDLRGALADRAARSVTTSNGSCGSRP